MSEARTVAVRRRLTWLWTIALVASILSAPVLSGGSAVGDEQFTAHDSVTGDTVAVDASATTDTDGTATAAAVAAETVSVAPEPSTDASAEATLGGDEDWAEYTFEFSDGTVITGSNRLGESGYTGKKNEADLGLSQTVHVSCSDPFPDGWGEKGAPVEGVDPYPIVSYHIDKYKDGEFKKSCGDEFVPPPPPPPPLPDIAVAVEKYVSVDGGAWQDADDPTGPAAPEGANVSFRFEVVNTGEVELFDLSLTDTDFSTASCSVPVSLAPGEGFDCEIGPFAAQVGQHANTATVVGVDAEGGTPAHEYQGEKYRYTFLLADGTVLDGSSGDKNAEVGLSDTVHLSCSDEFGFGDGDPGNDGFGEKGAPVEGVDSPIVFYLITHFKDDGTVEKTCGDGEPARSASDADPAHYIGTPPEPAIDIEKFVSVDGGPWVDADDPTGPEAFTGLSEVRFRFEVANTGEATLTNITLGDTDFDTSSCVIPDSLAPGESFDCEIGPFVAQAGQHANVADTMGEFGSVVEVPLPYEGVKRSYYFELADGTIIQGSSQSGDVEVGLSDKLHVSCSDDFGFDDSDPGNDGFGEKGAPVQGIDPPIVKYRIDVYKSDGEWDKSCGFGDLDTLVKVFDDDPAHYIGVAPAASVGDFVWNDENQNGIQDPGEQGVAGVTVKLQAPDGTVLAETTTDATGFYEFTGLVPGDYKLMFNLPAGFAFSPQDQGGDDTVDSDADPAANGMTAVFTLDPQENDPTWDAGIHLLLPSVDIEKLTNGLDSDTPTGALIPPGDPIEWTYIVTNAGNNTLVDLVVTDDILGQICTIDSLAAGETAVCTASGSAEPGQYANVGDVVGMDQFGNIVVDQDPSHYFGFGATIDVEKWVQGRDADAPPGPYIEENDPIRFTFLVTNTGTVDLIDIVVTDDVYGDVCTISGPLAPGHVEVCIIDDLAVGVPHVNSAIAVGQPVDDNGDPIGDPVSDEDPAHYRGWVADIDIEKATNGEDADVGPGPAIPVGDPVVWTYVVTNLSNVDLDDVVVTDDELGLICEIGFMAIGATATCTAEGIAGSLPYDNVGFATGIPVDDQRTPLTGIPVDDADPSHYIGVDSSITLVKSVNGEDANTPPGAYLPAGDPLTFTFDVTNDGSADLADVTVVDPDLGGVICVIPLLPAGATEQCTADGGPAAEGQHTNVATATGQPVDGNGDPVGDPVSDDDPANYFGWLADIDIEKATNGFDADDAADAPLIPVGDPVMWMYDVTNTGNVDLASVIVFDDQLGAICTIALLPAGGGGMCSASGVAAAGLYANLGTVSGTPVDAAGNVLGGPVDDDDPSHYLGVEGMIDIEKATNGEDADDPTGPEVFVGDSVTWTYVVTSNGDLAIADVVVTDSDAGVTPVFVGGDDNTNGLLDPGEAWVYEATGVAEAGQYENTGAVSGQPVDGNGDPLGGPVGDTDPSHYFGVELAAVGDFLWNDLNGDGIQDPGEPGIEGVTVSLFDVDGNVIDTTTTDANGNYLFTGLVPGQYYVVFGQPAGFDFTIANQGPNDTDSDVDATGRTTTFTLVAGQTDLTWDAGVVELAVGIDIEKFTKGGLGGIKSTGTQPGLLGEIDPDADPATAGEDADDPPGPFIPVGEPVTWTYFVTNTGDVPLFDVLVTDDVVGDICTIPEIQPGETIACVQDGTSEPGQYENTGTATGFPEVGVPVSDTDPSHYFGELADIQIIKDTRAGFEVVIQGDLVIFDITVTNTGNVDLANVEVGDPLVPDCAVFIGDLAVGESFVYECTLDPALESDVNVATVVGTPPSGNPVSDDDDAPFEVIVLAKIGDFVWNDLDADGIQDAGEPPVAGVVVHLLDDSSAIIDSTVTDADGMYMFSVVPGTYSVQFQPPTGFFFTVQDAGADDAVDSDADPATGETAPIVVGPGDEDLTWDAGLIAQASAIDVSKNAEGPDTQSVVRGGDVTFTITVTNTGNVDLSNVVVSDPLAPDCDAFIGALTVGASVSYECTVTNVQRGFENIAIVDGETPDGDPVGDEDPSTVDVLVPSIDIAKNAEGADTQGVPAGADVTFTITVTNTGEVDLSNVVVSDPLAPDCDAVIGALAVGASVSYECTVTNVLTGFTNIATVSGESETGEPVTDDDPSTVEVLEQGIDISKEAEGPDSREFVRGSDVTFTITVTNTGAVDLVNVVVSDPLAPDCDNVIGDLAAGATVSYECTVANVQNGFENIAIVSGDVPGGDPVGDEDPSTVVVLVPGIDIAKNAEGPDSQSVVRGSDVTFTITVTNTGEVDLFNVVVSDPLAPDCDAVIGALPVGAVVTYDCTVTDVQAGFENVATVSGESETGEPVSDDDPSTVEVDAPAIDISKQAEGPDSRDVVAGSDVTFTITVTNTGQVDLFNVAVSDPLALACDAVIGDLAVGAVVTYDCTVTNVQTGFENIAAVAGESGTGEPVSDEDPSTVVVLEPGLDISKQEEGPDSREFPRGSDVTFLITVANTGQVDLVNVVVSDPLAPECDNVIGDLAAGAIVAYECTVTNVEIGFENIATVTGDVPGDGTLTDDDPSTVVVLTPGIDISKNAEGPDTQSVIVGSDVTFGITVANTGEVDLFNVVVSDPLAPECDNVIGFLAVNTAVIYPCTVTNVQAGFTNIATVTGESGTGEPVSDEDPSTVEVDTPNIDVSKEAEGPDSREFVRGSDVTFTITVTNTGSVDLTNVVVSDPLAPECDNVIGDLAAGATVSYECTVTNAQNGFTNVATVTGDVPGGDPVTDDDPSTVVILTPSIDIAKNAEGPDTQTILQGEDVTFAITVTNSGDVDLVNVVVSDPLAPACDAVIGDLAVGASVTYECTVLAVLAEFTNIATVSGESETGEPVSDDDPSTVEVILLMSLGDTVWRDRGAEPNGVQDPDEPGVAGVVVELFTGAGDNVASTVTDADGMYLFTDLVAGDYFLVFTAPDGSTWTLQNAGADDVDSNVDAGGTTPVFALNGDDLTVDAGLIIPIDIELAKQAIPEGVFPGTDFVYQLRVENVGTVDAQDVVILDLLPYRDPALDPPYAAGNFVGFPEFSETTNGVGDPDFQIDATPGDDERNPLQSATFVSASDPSCFYDAGVNGVRCDIGDLAPGESVIIDLTLTMGPFAQIRVWNRAYVYADDVELNLDKNDPTSPCATDPGSDPFASGFGCNYAKKNEAVIGEIDLSAQKDVDSAEVTAGDTLNYTLIGTNHGPSGAREGTVVDQLPVGLTFVSASPGCTYVGGTHSVECTVGLWLPDTSAEFGVTTTVDAGAAGTLLNVANVEDRDPSEGKPQDMDPSNDTDDASSVVLAQQTPVIDLEVQKVVAPASVTAGGQVSFAITVTNKGPDDATGVTLVDLNPTGLTIVSTAGDGTFTAATGIWSVGDLAAGTSAVITMVVTVDDAGSFTNTVEVIAAGQTDSDSTPGDGQGDDFAMATVLAVAVLPQTQTTTTTTTTVAALPSTGMDTDLLGGLGFVLLALGGIAVLGVRRRQDGIR